MARHRQRSLNAGRREDAWFGSLAAKLGQLRAAEVAILLRRSPCVVRGQMLHHKRRRRARERLRRRRDLSRHIALRHRPLFHRKHRHARIAIQHVQKSRLVSLHHHRNLFAVAPNRRQQRRRSAVVVPQIVMHQLKAPRQLPRLRMQRNHGVGPLVVARTQAAVVVGARAAGGDEHQITRSDPPPSPTTHSPRPCSTLQLPSPSGCGFDGIGSQLQRSAPVRASNARTTRKACPPDCCHRSPSRRSPGRRSLQAATSCGTNPADARPDCGSHIPAHRAAPPVLRGRNHRRASRRRVERDQPRIERGFVDPPSAWLLRARDASSQLATPRLIRPSP